MKKMVSAILLLVATHVHAATIWTANQAPKGIQTQPDGGFVLTLPNGTGPTCNASGANFVVKENQGGMTASGVKSTLAVVLTAQASGKLITVAYDNATANCYVVSVFMHP